MSAITPTQISFRQILIATDLSDASANALNYAKVLAKRYDFSHCAGACLQATQLHCNTGRWLGRRSVTQKSEEEIEALGAELRAEGYATEAINTFGSIKDEICRSPKLMMLTLLSWEHMGGEGSNVCCSARRPKL